jgi:leucyl/phenylalanyl-tRNA---protein transferase
LQNPSKDFEVPGTDALEELTPEMLLRAYAMGIFPMSEGRNDAGIHWVDPRRRGILPLDGFHLSRSLARCIRQGRFRITADTAFAAVVDGCAERKETWISLRIQRLYCSLHRLGFAHSIEVWDESQLVGGVYGVSLGAVFFGESMFSRVTDASKVALAYCVDRLRAGGFRLFDTQFLTPHLASLGGREIGRDAYLKLLSEEIAKKADFFPTGYSPSPSGVAASLGASGRMQPRTQTS